MSIASLASFAAAEIAPILIKPQRGIKDIKLPNGKTLTDIYAQATVSERHMDRMAICTHPIEQGAEITDHAFKHPAEVYLQLGWSNSPSILGIQSVASLIENSNLSGSGLEQITAIYEQLLNLQINRAIFTIYTGKRKYTNMMCKFLATETDFKTANSLPISMECQEVILVNTRTVAFQASQVSNPSQNASPVESGTLTTTPISPSAPISSFNVTPI